MKKMIIFGFGLLLAAGAVMAFVDKPLTAQEALLMRNVEALADGETVELPCRWTGNMDDVCEYDCHMENMPENASGCTMHGAVNNDD